MTTLHVRLFQNLEVWANGTAPLDMGSPTARSLFAYLVLNQDQAIDRRRLAFLFWPRGSEQAARRNLRQYLHRIRRSLEPVDPEGTLLLAEGNSLRFVPPPTLNLDVAQFEAMTAPPGRDLARAVELYKGPLLEDIYDDWVQPERERLSALYRECLQQLIDERAAQHKYAEAIAFGQRYLTADPLTENAYLRLMRLHYLAGNRANVKLVYQQLAEVMRQELDAEPLPETTAVYQAMLSGSYGTTVDTPNPAQLESEPARPRGPATAFVGRDDELRWLDDAFAAASQAQAATCFIQGESGVGKSRLVDEWLQRLETPVFQFSGRGHEFESMIPYSLLAQALRDGARATVPWELFQPPPPWIGALLPLLPDLPTYLPGYEAHAAGPVAHHIIESLGNFFLTLARRRPLILYLDNLHWADAPTWNFLGFLAQRAGQSQILIIGVARAEDMPPERDRLVRKLARAGQLRSLILLRLSQEETGTLVHQLMPGEDIDPRFVRRIYEETEGNPFFIIETIRAVREAGGDWTDSVPTDAAGHRPHFAIPLQVQAVIESRLDKLNPESRAALGVAAAIGRGFTFDLLQEACQVETEQLLNDLDEWLARQLVRESRDGYEFTHEKLSQVAYDKLTRARRQWVHFQIGERLASGPADVDPAQLAHHFYLSNHPDRALPYLAQAGERALSVRSYAEAREFGLRAIGLLGRYPNPAGSDHLERVDLNLQLAQAHAFTGAYGKALKMLQETERMAQSLGSMRRLAQIFHRSAQIFWLQGEAATAGDYTRRTLRHAEEMDDTELRYAALRMLGRVGIVLSSYDDAIAYLLRYIDLAGSGQMRASDLPAIYGYLGVAYARVGSWQRAIDAAQKGLEMASTEMTGAMHVVARMQLAYVYAELHEWQQALAIADPVRDLWQEEGMTPHAFMLRAVVGRCLVQLGDPERGPAEIQEALRWAEQVDYRVQRHVVYLYLAQAQYGAGMLEAAGGTAVKTIEMAQAAGSRWSEAVARRTLAEIEMTAKKPRWSMVEANLLGAMDSLRQIRARPDLARTFLSLRRLYDRAGQVAWAVDCHFRATTIFDELGMDEERRAAQGQPGGERTGAVVIPGLALRGPVARQDPDT